MRSHLLAVRAGLAIGAIVALAFPAAAQTTQTTFSNTTAITIPGVGAATPFPSEIAVSGMMGNITNLTVTLNSLSHNFPDDLDILMVGPTGTNVLLMSDCGGGQNLSNVTLTFSDAATVSLPNGAGTTITTGTYRPTNFEAAVDTFPNPAPEGPFGETMSSFFGLSPNGIYSLYIRDDSALQNGTISGGWSMTVTTTVPEPGTFALLGLGIAGAAVMARRRTAAKA